MSDGPTLRLDHIPVHLGLGADDAIINPPGVWHTADIAGTATALFVTAATGTRNRLR